ncbi:peroxidase 57-like [Olea europaea subsp. europaea]|uniref:Peroxidase n=1 Tax=Olea europaea subsp. europaea TaxID=158383 RepID=A0A8S0RCK2_OLEEU|nr:peroxidase 57-like [Olea europaea subsp. europaea]
MASRGSIHLSIIFFFLAILPLLASAFPGFFHVENSNSPFQNDGVKTFFGAPIFRGKGENEEASLPSDDVGEQEKPLKYESRTKEETGVKGTTKGRLREGFYEKTCPQAELIVNDVMNKAFQNDSGLAAALLRLFFHDCFVTGCDASILLDKTPGGEEVEKASGANGMFIRGFEAIDEIKRKLEYECPSVVSCADILAFANRESLVFSGLPSYNVAAGRRDSLTSLAKNVENNVPLPDQTTQQITALFNRKGLTVEEMVVLTGAHSIGIAHCANIIERFWDQQKRKEIEPGYHGAVGFSCGNDPEQIFPFDTLTEYKMDSHFYKQVLNKRALIESDQNMARDPQTANIMKTLADDQEGWFGKFIKTIIKLGEIEVLTGDQGEIRKQCRAFNQNTRGIFGLA